MTNRQTTQNTHDTTHNQALLHLKNISRHYFHYGIFQKSKKQILSNISLDIYPNQAIGLIGLSGSGKSTLARIMCGLEKPDSGEILFLGKKISLKSLQNRKAFYKQVQILFQDSLSSLNPRYTIYENLSEVLTYLLEIKDKNAQLECILPILKQLRLDEKILYSYPAMLSGGQAQRICIARVLLVRPKLLLLDEITSNLYYILKEEVLEIFSALQRENACSFVFITHDLSLARKFCHKLLLLDKGELIEEIANTQRFQSALGKELDGILF